jgi:organic radical activating enzyme
MITLMPDDFYIQEGNLEITTKIGCSQMCEYCPQLKLIEEYKKGKQKTNKVDKMMTLDNFKNYISTIPEVIDFHFTGYVEPFDNPNCHEFLLIAHEKGHKLQINTTLDGLTKEKFDKIRHLPFKQFIIHLASATYKEEIGRKRPRSIRPSGQPELRQDWLDLLDYVGRNQPINFKLVAHGGAHEQAIQVLQNLANEGLLNQSHIANLYIKTSTRSQNKAQDNIKIIRQKIPPPYNIRGKCARIHQSVLMPDGRMGLCCQDYGLEHVLGDLSKQTWAEYKTSDSYKEVVSQGANLCDYCDMGYHTYGDKE